MRPDMLGLALLLASCGAPPECIDRLDCGDLEICTDGACQPVECVATPDCPIGDYCEGEAHTCIPGCDSAEGCLAGEDCNDHECVAYECRNTPLDCGIGQLCDAASGACEDGPGCEPCSGEESADCGAGQCVDFDEGAGTSFHCILPCLAVDDPEGCPRGLECRDLSGQGDLFCYADCPVYLNESRDR